MTFIEIVVIYLLILCTYVSGKMVVNKNIITHTSILNQALIESYTYSKNMCGYDFLSSEMKEQDKFVAHSIGFLRLNYGYTLKELNMFNSDEKLCSMLVSKITGA